MRFVVPTALGPNLLFAVFLSPPQCRRIVVYTIIAVTCRVSCAVALVSLGQSSLPYPSLPVTSPLSALPAPFLTRPRLYKELRKTQFEMAALYEEMVQQVEPAAEELRGQINLAVEKYNDIDVGWRRVCPPGGWGWAV